ncbi:hypothetical protein NXW84_05525 [Bacteroides fragilis]|nr:hypothetical protein NXW84_05525 [Bacteroides fragilis]
MQMESYIGFRWRNRRTASIHFFNGRSGAKQKKQVCLMILLLLFLPITVITGFWGMNQISEVMEENGELSTGFIIQSLLLIIGTHFYAICIIYKKEKENYELEISRMKLH